MTRPRCTTHHHACDCREAKHSAEVEYLSAELGQLRTEIGRLREAVRVNARDRGIYPHLRRKYDQNIAPVDRLRAALAKLKEDAA